MSVILEIHKGNKNALTIDIVNLSSIYNIDLNTLEDIYFGLKVTATDADETVFIKTLVQVGGDLVNYPGGITIVENKIVIPFDGVNDWDNLAVNEEYLICLAIKRTGQTSFDEVIIGNDPLAKIKILQDKVRR